MSKIPDEYTATPEQQLQWVQAALIKDGFEQMPISRDSYFKEVRENVSIIVNLAGGKHDISFLAFGNRIDDDKDGMLERIGTLIADAMTGAMPSKKEPDEIIKQPADVPDEAPSKPLATPTPAGHNPQVHVSPQPLTPFTPAGRMIKGLTPSLKEIGKIKIGRKGANTTESGYRLPEKFDHFEVVSVHKNEQGDFIPDEPIMAAIGQDAKELDVTLLYNDPTLNFMTRYNEYKGGKCMCSGDGVDAIKEDGTKVVCDPETCSTFKAKKCKPNGVLSVILKQAPRLGGVYKFRTTSFNSIRSILSSMFFIQSLTGGLLANIPLKMTVSPMTVNPAGSKTAQTIYVVNLEFPGTVEELHKQTVALITETASMQHKIAELEAQARAALVGQESTEEIQDIEAEFYPEVQA